MKKLFLLTGLLFAGLLYVGCSDDYPTQSSDDLEIVSPRGAGGEEVFAGKKGGGNADDTTYFVTIDVPGFGYGEAAEAPYMGKSIGEATMSFTFLAGRELCPNTTLGDVTVTGIFTIMLRQNRRDPGAFTYGMAEMWGFDIEGIHGLEFDIDENQIDPDGNWLPALGTPVILTGGNGGDGLNMELWSRKKNHACTGEIGPNYWTITVERNPIP